MDSFWSSSSEADSLPAFGDYQNVADEDIWTRLKRVTHGFADNAYENTWGNTYVSPINVDSGLAYASSEFESTRQSKHGQLALIVTSSSETPMVHDYHSYYSFLAL